MNRGVDVSDEVRVSVKVIVVWKVDNAADWTGELEPLMLEEYAVYGDEESGDE